MKDFTNEHYPKWIVYTSFSINASKKSLNGVYMYSLTYHKFTVNPRRLKSLSADAINANSISLSESLWFGSLFRFARFRICRPDPAEARWGLDLAWAFGSLAN